MFKTNWKRKIRNLKNSLQHKKEKYWRGKLFIVALNYFKRILFPLAYHEKVLTHVTWSSILVVYILLAVMFLYFAEQSITSWFGVSQQHWCVSFVKYRVVYISVSCTHRPFHYNWLKYQNQNVAGVRIADLIGTIV